MESVFIPTLKCVLGQQLAKQVSCPAEPSHRWAISMPKQMSKARVNLRSLTHYPYKSLIRIH